VWLPEWAAGSAFSSAASATSTPTAAAAISLRREDRSADPRDNLGHGVGLEVREPPNLAPAARDVLVAGDVLAIEPVLRDSRIGEARLEDLVLVTEHGCETLTRFPYDLAPCTQSVAVAGHRG
jgi:Xaa-Pro aminopeptidase